MREKKRKKMLTMTIYLLSKYIEEVATCPYLRTKKKVETYLCN